VSLLRAQNFVPRVTRIAGQAPALAWSWRLAPANQGRVSPARQPSAVRTFPVVSVTEVAA